MSNEPIGKFFTPGPDGQGDEHQFERLLRLVEALQASSANTPSEEALVRQQANHASPVVLKRDSLRREVEARAYQIYLERGGHHGCDMADWLQAEMELREKLGLGREKAIMRLALAWGMPHNSSEAASVPG